MDYTMIILNQGLYQMRMINSVPGWVANEGEGLLYSDGAGTRRLYFYIDTAWRYIEWTGSGSGFSMNWIRDADLDTKVDTEETSDEDYVRIDTGGTEALVVDPNQDVEVKAGSFFVPENEKVGFEGLAGDTYLKWNSSSLNLELYVQNTLRISA